MSILTADKNTSIKQTFLIPVFDVGTLADQQFDQFFVTPCASQRQRSVLVRLSASFQVRQSVFSCCIFIIMKQCFTLYFYLFLISLSVIVIYLSSLETKIILLVSYKYNKIPVTLHGSLIWLVHLIVLTLFRITAANFGC